MSGTVSITGAAGKTGRAVVAALVEFGIAVRAVVHRPEAADEMRELGVAEVALADLEDGESLARALSGSKAVYFICPNMHPEEVEIGRRVIEACRRAGTGRLVYHSVLHPQVEAMPHHWKKMRVEEALIECGLSVTILQPAAYMQNLRAQWHEVTSRGVLAVPYAAATRLGMVDLADVAEAAARVLTEAGHEAATYELCGPEVHDQGQVAAVLAGALDRSVRVEVQDRSDWSRWACESGLSTYAVESLTAMFRHYERHGFHGNPRVLESLLGRPSGRLAAVVERWS